MSDDQSTLHVGHQRLLLCQSDTPSGPFGLSFFTRLGMPIITGHCQGASYRYR
jgi:hypothetical protein